MSKRNEAFGVLQMGVVIW